MQEKHQSGNKNKNKIQIQKTTKAKLEKSQKIRTPNEWMLASTLYTI